jgi:hypothetical protein
MHAAHSYTSQTYASAFQQLDKACEWLKEIGINYSPTRIGRYRRIFADLARFQGKDTILDFFKEYDLDDFKNAAHETVELVRIYEGLHLSSDTALTNRLRTALRGHEMYILDNDNRSGRDFMFELSVAAKFARNGYTIDFGTNADVDVVIDGIPFFVECKRLKSGSSIPKRIKEGLEQLRKRYDASTEPGVARGILALSIGKILNPKLGMIEGTDPKTVSAIASRHNDAFVKKHQRQWQSDQDKRTLGALVILDTPGKLIPENKIVTIHEVAINNSLPISPDDEGFLMNLIDKVFVRKPDEPTGS